MKKDSESLALRVFLFLNRPKNRPDFVQRSPGGAHLLGSVVVTVTAAAAVAGAACAVLTCLVIFPHGAAGQTCAQNYDCQYNESSHNKLLDFMRG